MKTIIITGASRGIGKATTKKFLLEGWYVIGTSSSGTIDVHNENFIPIQLDYLQKDTINKAAQMVVQLNKRIDVLVNNAAIGEEENGEGINIEILRKTLEINLIGTADFTNRMLPLLADKAHIINISSQLGSLNDFYLASDWVTPSYQISKAALNMFTCTLAALLEKKRVMVSSLDPGWVKTDMGGQEATRIPEEPANEIYELATSKPETGQFWRSGKKRNW